MLNFVEYHQPIQITERQHGIGETGHRGRILEIETGDLTFEVFANRGREGRLANLAGAKQTDNRKSREQTLYGLKVSGTVYHAAILS